MTAQTLTRDEIAQILDTLASEVKGTHDPETIALVRLWLNEVMQRVDAALDEKA
jgi:hypothetical protein